MYPVTITRDDLISCDISLDLIKAFDAVAEDGVVTIRDADHHAEILQGPLAQWAACVVEKGLIFPLTPCAGDDGIATAGKRGMAQAGKRGRATVGDYGMATAGAGGMATAGAGGIATAGIGGQATAGDDGMATAGIGGMATAGIGGQATVGSSGMAQVGERGRAQAGIGGSVRGGKGAELQIRWFDQISDRYRTAIAYVGEDGILSDTWYKLDDKGQFVRADAAAW